MIALVRDRLPELAALCRRYNVRRLALFGSAASGPFAPERSDLDFLVEFATLRPIRRAECYFGLLQDMEQLFGRPIDLVDVAAVRNPYFAQAVAASQEPIYEAA
jgi:predicted nucleotidyltransferase